jgi:hypothetical protein
MFTNSDSGIQDKIIFERYSVWTMNGIKERDQGRCGKYGINF